MNNKNNEVKNDEIVVEKKQFFKNKIAIINIVLVLLIIGISVSFLFVKKDKEETKNPENPITEKIPQETENKLANLELVKNYDGNIYYDKVSNEIRLLKDDDSKNYYLLGTSKILKDNVIKKKIVNDYSTSLMLNESTDEEDEENEEMTTTFFKDFGLNDYGYIVDDESDEEEMIQYKNTLCEDCFLQKLLTYEKDSEDYFFRDNKRKKSYILLNNEKKYITIDSSIYNIFGTSSAWIEDTWDDSHEFEASMPKTKYVIFKTENKKFGVLNKNDFSIVLKPDYDFLNYTYDENIFVAKSNKKYGLIKVDGSIIIDYEYSYLDEMDNKKTFYIEKNSKSGFIDSDGKVLTNIEFDNEYYVSNTSSMASSYYIVSKNGKYGLLDSKFNQKLNYEYNWIYAMNDSFIFAHKGEKLFLYNSKFEKIFSEDYEYDDELDEYILPDELCNTVTDYIILFSIDEQKYLYTEKGKKMVSSDYLDIEELYDEKNDRNYYYTVKKDYEESGLLNKYEIVIYNEKAIQTTKLEIDTTIFNNLKIDLNLARVNIEGEYAIVDVLDTDGKEFVCFVYDTKSFDRIYESNNFGLLENGYYYYVANNDLYIYKDNEFKESINGVTNYLGGYYFSKSDGIYELKFNE